MYTHGTTLFPLVSIQAQSHPLVVGKTLMI